MFRKIQFFFQKVFRKTHTSDNEVWGLYYYIAKKALPMLREFRRGDYPGIPFDFCTKEDLPYLSEEEYQQKITNGELTGGGEAKWRETIDKIIFSIDYIVNYDLSNKKRKKFCLRHNVQDPFEEKEEYLEVSYTYKVNERIHWVDQENKKDFLKNHPEAILLHQNNFYYNMEAQKNIDEQLVEGLNLFGKYFMSLGD